MPTRPIIEIVASSGRSSSAAIVSINSAASIPTFVRSISAKYEIHWMEATYCPAIGRRNW